MIHEFNRLEPQTSPIRKLLDPRQTLPCIGLEPTEDRDGRCINHGPQFRCDYNVTIASDTVGYAIIGDRTDGRGYYFINVEINDKYIRARSGIGRAVYALAIETAHLAGKGFTTGDTVSVGARRVWDNFTTLGIVEVEKPFWKVGGPKDNNSRSYYAGRLRIPPLE